MVLKLGMIFFLLRIWGFGSLANRFILGSGLVMMIGRAWDSYILNILWVIIFLLRGLIIVTEGDMVFGFPSVVFLIIALPFDEAKLSVCIVIIVLFIHLICATLSTS
jgi:hypothetical protein